MSGNTILRMIFSMTIGTTMTMAGWMSAQALWMSDGLGRRVRKKRWLPKQKLRKNSTIMLYMWAMGSVQSTLDPGAILAPRLRIVKSRLLHSAR